MKKYSEYLCEQLNCLCISCANYECREERQLVYCTRCRGRESKYKIICVDYKQGV